ncbi:alpha/beta hydrolase [Streptomyces sp. A7024]|uniref:Alpha/beta hydrolase n=1 Tax=Streptomyces coryli TaxID=1128680 RepID=A0A6G4UDP8_9ACTN|nr:alpha/beta hydrolase [Streptomyces coryli]NGN69796.1 alpha/beta hydrolase [Streptomyces coryli]
MSEATPPGNWARAGRTAGFAGAAIGVVAAGAAAGVALERMTVGRGMRRKARLALDAASPYGILRGRAGTALADDGTELHYEVEEVEDFPLEGAVRPKRRGRRFGRRSPAPLTVVFSHGYCLSQDSWHFQRAALRGIVRTVYWDQRSHGRSARGAAQLEGEPVAIDQLGRDLKAVLDAAAPEGPLLLVGHSMGGMTQMALAGQYPDLVAERVAGTAFVGTSVGGLGQVNFGLPVAGARAFQRLAPGVLKLLGGHVGLVEKGRHATSDLFAGIIKRYSFSAHDIDPAISRFAERMIEATPIDVVAEFYPAFGEHDKADALAASYADRPSLVLCGDKDLVTPPEHSDVMAELLPDAEHIIVEDAGHLVMLEHPERVNDALVALLARASAYGAAELGRGRRSTRGQAEGASEQSL